MKAPCVSCAGLSAENAAVGSQPFRPIAVVEVELSAAIPALPADDAGRYGSVRLFTRLHGHPLGSVDLDAAEDGFSAERCAEAIWASLASEINHHLRADGLPPLSGLTAAGISTVGAPRCQAPRRAVLAQAPFASVVVCTKDRPDAVDRVLASIAQLDYPNFETIVVDGSAASETEQLVRDHFPAVRYVRLAGGGVVVGRNRALLEAKAEMLAYVDDDAVVDRDWLSEHIAGSATSRRTSPAPPASLFRLNWSRKRRSGSRSWGRSWKGRSSGRSRWRTAHADPCCRTPPAGSAQVSAWPGGRPPCAQSAASIWRLTAWARRTSRRSMTLSVPATRCRSGLRRWCITSTVASYEVLTGQVRSYARGLGAYLARCLLTRPSTDSGLPDPAAGRPDLHLQSAFDPQQQAFDDLPQGVRRDPAQGAVGRSLGLREGSAVSPLGRLPALHEEDLSAVTVVEKPRKGLVLE
jgi:hypothetical protein